MSAKRGPVASGLAPNLDVAVATNRTASLRVLPALTARLDAIDARLEALESLPLIGCPYACGSRCTSVCPLAVS